MKRTRFALLLLALVIPTACGDHDPTGIQAPVAPLYEVSTPAAAPAGVPGGDTSPDDAGIILERGPNTMGSGG